MLFAAAHSLRIGLRTWRRSPGIAATAVLTLALGIGAATALFSVLYGVLVRPLPYRAADRLVMIEAEQDYEGAARPVRARFPTAAAAVWPEGGPLIRTAFFADNVGALALQSGSEIVSTAIVEGPFFETIDGPIVFGRALSPADGAEPVAVISERMWRQRFAGDNDVLGRRLTLSGQVLTIVGVVADGFQIPAPSTDLWMSAATTRLRNPACCGFAAIARMADGVTLPVARDYARETVRTIAAQLPRQLADTRVDIRPLRETLVAQARPALLVLGVSVSLLLALAVANVAGLLLARQASRAHEAGVRRALGASSLHVMGDALAEGIWVVAAGCALGVGLAIAGVRALQILAANALPRLDAVAVDGRALAVAVAAAALIALLVGLLPLGSARARSGLESRERVATLPPRTRRLLGAITSAQLAISVVLLVAASLLGRSLVALLETDMGIRPQQVATASINLAMSRTLTSQQQSDLVAQVVERVAAAPDVVAAGVGTSRPPDTSRMRLTLSRGGDTSERATYQAAGVPSTPGYFTALGLRLEKGRFFTDADTAEAPPVVVLSAGTARRMFPDRDPIGQQLELPVVRDGKHSRAAMTVVGVAGDVKFNGLDQAADDVVYRPFAQQPWVSAFLFVRTTGDAEAVATRLRATVAAVDPDITLADTRSMDAVLSSVTSTPRVRSAILGTFAVMAIAIAAVGLYGVVAYSVSQRRTEMGVRMAMGADGGRIRRMVLGEGLRLAIAGVIGGVAAAAAGSRVLTSLLYGVSTSDVVSFAVASAGVVAIGMAATWLPAHRASRTDPATVLRGD